MKTSPFFLLLVLSLSPALQGYSQVIPSSCEIPWVLTQEYDLDVKNLAVKNMMIFGSPDTVYVTIPQSQQTPIMEGIAAIFNMNHPARDSVFDMYCVHDRSFRPVGHDYLILVDTSVAWTQNWQNLQTMTGVPALDSLLTAYDLQVTGWFNIIGYGYALLNSTQLWNPYAMADSLQWASPAIIHVEPDWLIGAAGAILYEENNGIRHYEFSFQWNDCFDGCDNVHSWLFDVNPDCSVNYLGTFDWFVFNWEPMPDPVNCNITTGKPPVNPVSDPLSVYPNPSSDKLYITLPGKLSRFDKLEVFDLSGKIHRVGSQVDQSNCVLDISSLPEGLYLVNILSEKQSFSAKFIK